MAGERVSSSAEGRGSAARLTLSQRLSLAVMLFSMFFGAGNLILPPFLGYLSGTEAPAATVGFLVSGIGLPVLGVVSVAFSGDIRALAGRVGPRFAQAFVALVYLAIGPCLAIPRTSSTAFEMLVPLLPEGTSVGVAQLAFSVAFFAVALAMAMRPGALSRLLGRITGPLLIALVVLIVGAAVVAPSGVPGPVQAPYDAGALPQGFLTGYQTMDLLASLTFGLVIAKNACEMGVSEKGRVAAEVSRAGVVAGVLMALIYCGLAWVGVSAGEGAVGSANGAAVLSASAAAHFGVGGTALVAAIFLLACLNVCVGLVSCCGTYFAATFGADAERPVRGFVGRLGYRAWALAFAGFSCAVSNLGLTAIVAFSVPLLSSLYPPAIVLVLLGMARGRLGEALGRHRLAWVLSVTVSIVVSASVSVRDAVVPALGLPFDALPLAGVGMAWVVPTVVALVVGLAVRNR